MKVSTKRILAATAFLLLAILGIFIDTGLGTACSFGWSFIASVCPAGILYALAAGKAVPWSGVICVAILVVLTLIFGRAFCGWICPVPLTRRLFGGKKGVERSASSASYVGVMAQSRRAYDKVVAKLEREIDEADEDAEDEGEQRGKNRSKDETSVSGDSKESKAQRVRALAKERGIELPQVLKPVEAERIAREQLPELPQDGKHHVRIRSSKRDIRLAIVIIGIVTALIFGFPVFCLVCPVGLTFATFVVLVQMVKTGTFTMAIVVFPAIIAVELLVLRRWCHEICPIGALLALISRGNRTLRPTADLTKCVEITKGVHCDACFHACPEGIDLHHLDTSVHPSECLKCAECVHACPVQAITMPFLPSKPKNAIKPLVESAGNTVTSSGE